MQLSQPLCQSVLPILTKETGRMHGVILIPNQVFRGDRDVEVSPGKFLKATVVKGFPSSERLGHDEFMALVFPLSEERKRPWLGYSMFLSSDDIGAMSEWYCWIFKQGIKSYLGNGAQQIREGIWSSQETAWDPDNPNDPNNPAINIANRPDIGYGSEDWGNSDIPETPDNPNTKNLKWNFKVEKLRFETCSYLDVDILEVFRDSLKYYKLSSDTPKSIIVKDKPKDFRVGFLYNVSEPNNHNIPTIVRFLHAGCIKKGCYDFRFLVEGNLGYNVDISLEIV